MDSVRCMSDTSRTCRARMHCRYIGRGLSGVEGSAGLSGAVPANSSAEEMRRDGIPVAASALPCPPQRACAS